jgi:hypothetical protein
MANEESLRLTLEKTWNAYIEASRSGRESELQETMSSFMLITMKNNLATANRSLTSDMIKSIAKYAPDTNNAKYVTLLEKGATAGLVYIKDSEEKNDSGKPQVTFIFIKFVKENLGWKVDGAISIGSQKFQEDGKESEFNVSDLPPEYKIDGKVRTAPKPIESPFASAFIDVMSYGYKIDVVVNGSQQDAFAGGSHSGLLKGGLRKGKNDITIVIKQTEKNAMSNPSVVIRRALENDKTKEVFKYEPKENSEGEHTFTFDIQ